MAVCVSEVCWTLLIFKFFLKHLYFFQRVTVIYVDHMITCVMSEQDNVNAMVLALVDSVTSVLRGNGDFPAVAHVNVMVMLHDVTL